MVTVSGPCLQGKMVTARRYPHMITIQPQLTGPGTLTLTSPGLGEVRVQLDRVAAGDTRLEAR